MSALAPPASNALTAASCPCHAAMCKAVPPAPRPSDVPPRHKVRGITHCHSEHARMITEYYPEEHDPLTKSDT
eukprot:1185901-Prorocentrum_minimum.AAC.9